MERYLGVHTIRWVFINMSTIKDEDQGYMLTARYWVSMTIKNMRACYLDADLISRLGHVNLAMDNIIFKAEGNFAKWAKTI